MCKIALDITPIDKKTVLFLSKIDFKPSLWSHDKCYNVIVSIINIIIDDSTLNF